MDTHESDVKQTKSVVIGLTCVAFVLITGISTCVMHGHEVTAKNTKAQTIAIEALIATGVDPVKARCYIIGWKNERDALICTVSGATKSKDGTSKPK